MAGCLLDIDLRRACAGGAGSPTIAGDVMGETLKSLVRDSCALPAATPQRVAEEVERRCRGSGRRATGETERTQALRIGHRPTSAAGLRSSCIRQAADRAGAGGELRDRYRGLGVRCLRRVDRLVEQSDRIEGLNRLAGGPKGSASSACYLREALAVLPLPTCPFHAVALALGAVLLHGGTPPRGAASLLLCALPRRRAVPVHAGVPRCGVGALAARVQPARGRTGFPFPRRLRSSSTISFTSSPCSVLEPRSGGPRGPLGAPRAHPASWPAQTRASPQRGETAMAG